MNTTQIDLSTNYYGIRQADVGSIECDAPRWGLFIGEGLLSVTVRLVPAVNGHDICMDVGMKKTSPVDAIFNNREFAEWVASGANIDRRYAQQVGWSFSLNTDVRVEVKQIQIESAKA